ncbi:hypothetical protein ABK040_001514 [Willaertia magna]
MQLNFFNEGLTGPNIKVFSDEKEGLITWKEENSYKGLSFALSSTGISSGKMSCTICFVSLNKDYRNWLGVQSKKQLLTFTKDSDMLAMIGGRHDCTFNEIYLGVRTEKPFQNLRLLAGDSIDMLLDMDAKEITFNFKKNGMDFSHSIKNLPNEKLHFALGVSTGVHIVVTNYKIYE